MKVIHCSECYCLSKLTVDKFLLLVIPLTLAICCLVIYHQVADPAPFLLPFSPILLLPVYLMLFMPHQATFSRFCLIPSLLGITHQIQKNMSLAAASSLHLPVEIQLLCCKFCHPQLNESTSLVLLKLDQDFWWNRLLSLG